MQRVVVAYSGGVDSSVLAGIAHDVLGDGSLAVTAVSPSLSRRALRDAESQAAAFGWNHMTVETREVDRPEYARNEPDRCYWCKVELFHVLRPIAAARAARVALGTNDDDAADFRPGARAAREEGAVAPLAEAGLTKVEIRTLASEMGLPSASKPAAPCLASRFAYGVRVTEPGLRRIDRAEDLIRSLGFADFRVRDHGDIARIEVPPADIERAARLHDEIHRELHALGWAYVTVDLGGFRSGSLNEVLRIRGPRGTADRELPR